MKKSWNFLGNLKKLLNFSLIFYKFFENFSGVRGRSPRNPPRGDPPYKPSPGGSHFAPEKNPAGAHENNAFLENFLRKFSKIFLKFFLIFLNIFWNFLNIFWIFFENFLNIFWEFFENFFEKVFPPRNKVLATPMLPALPALPLATSMLCF